MDIRRQNGVALIIVTMALLLLTALGVMLTLTTSLETTIAGNFRESLEAFYAADASLEHALDAMATVGDWNTLVDGSQQSSFVDGAPSGVRTLADGSTVDLVQLVSRANCRKVTPCSSAEMDQVTTERPWGANNPRWQLYAYGRLRDLLPSGTIDSSYYVIVMVADDPSENDNDPLRDGTHPDNPGSGVLALRAETFGPHGTHKMIETIVRRSRTAEPGPVRVLSWRDVR